jgi:hypothetical protein
MWFRDKRYLSDGNLYNMTWSWFVRMAVRIDSTGSVIELMGILNNKLKLWYLP